MPVHYKRYSLQCLELKANCSRQFLVNTVLFAVVVFTAFDVSKSGCTAHASESDVSYLLVLQELAAFSAICQEEKVMPNMKDPHCNI